MTVSVLTALPGYADDGPCIIDLVTIHIVGACAIEFGHSPTTAVNWAGMYDGRQILAVASTLTVSRAD